MRKKWISLLTVLFLMIQPCVFAEEMTLSEEEHLPAASSEIVDSSTAQTPKETILQFQTESDSSSQPELKAQEKTNSVEVSLSGGTLNLLNGSSVASQTFDTDEETSFILLSQSSHSLPSTIHLTIAGQEAPNAYTYDAQTGIITLLSNRPSGTVRIEADFPAISASSTPMRKTNAADEIAQATVIPAQRILDDTEDSSVAESTAVTSDVSNSSARGQYLIYAGISLLTACYLCSLLLKQEKKVHAL